MDPPPQSIFYDETHHLLAEKIGKPELRTATLSSLLNKTWITWEDLIVPNLEETDMVKIQSLGKPDAVLNIAKISSHLALIETRDTETILNIRQSKELQEFKFYHPNVCRGLIKNMPVDITTAEIKQKLTSRKKILNVERMDRWDTVNNKKIPSKNILITFEGHIMPKTVEYLLTDKFVHSFKPKPYMQMDYMAVCSV